MAADDNLSAAQFFHGSKHKFEVGDVLTPHGAAVATYGQRAVDYNERMFGSPLQRHVYYTTDVNEAGGYGEDHHGEGGYTYQVRPETKTGRPVTKHQPDPNYKGYDIPAYRTTGQLRVLGILE